MLQSRIIPCLLIHNNGLVKTVKFSARKYVGDPLNAVKIFNEKKVDELIVLDIDATVKGEGPNYKLIKNIAAECRMPLCYGGGVRTVEDAKKILQLGVEKIAISAALIASPGLVTELANQLGSQSVVAVLDVKKRFLSNKYDIYTRNGTKKMDVELESLIPKLEDLGIGELVLNSIDKDGTMLGYDRTLISKVRKMTTVPLTVLGGAGTLGDISSIIKEYRVIGVAAGSLFVFKGKFKAVLINYPSDVQKINMINSSNEMSEDVHV
jgi:cyclase